MNPKKTYNVSNLFRPKILATLITTLSSGASSIYANEIEFNTDVLSINNQTKIDLSQFAQPGYIMPGEYEFTLHVNKTKLKEHTVFYYSSEKNDKESIACLSPEIVEQIGLKPSVLTNLQWWHNNECLDINSLPGLVVKSNLPTSSLFLSVPQASIEYQAHNWDPSSRWDEGISGLILDYNITSQYTEQKRTAKANYVTSANGVVGANAGPWRLRADWQARFNKLEGTPSYDNFDWSKFYAYRAIKPLKAKLTLGETYLTSDIFDSFRFTGVSLQTDTNMLPPQLRGYAPEVTGVANTNAMVIISQQGRVVYQTTVPAGPFRIQDLSEAVAGELDVRIEEQDGSVQTFTMNTATIPYLTRPGQIRYKLFTGKPSNWNHEFYGDIFGGGEFSLGVNNGWSLYGGTTLTKDYQAAAVGIGRDLKSFGALSFDITHSLATLDTNFSEESKYQGSSYRLSYSKHFDKVNGQITFAGYRFSEENFMSMAEFLDAQLVGQRNNSNKEMYTLSYQQQFQDIGLSAFVNYYHQSYWNQPANDRYTFSLAKYFNYGTFKNISASLTAYHNQNAGNKDYGISAGISIPWTERGSLGITANATDTANSARFSYYDRIDEKTSYQLSSTMANTGSSLSGYFTHQGNFIQLATNATYEHNEYQSAGLTLQGGMTLTTKGAVFHRGNQFGNSRILIDTDGIKNVPVRGYGSIVKTNSFGKAVIPEVNSYYRNKVSIDINKLDETTQVNDTIKEGTLTEGAIGYHKFDVISGKSGLFTIQLDNTDEAPPFGTSVHNNKGQYVGMVGNNGQAYLSGLNVNQALTLRWDEDNQCVIKVPTEIENNQTIPNGFHLACSLEEVTSPI